MTTKKKPSTSTPTAGQQRRQASVLLLRFQWLLIFLLIGALLWLYISQQRFENKVNERLQSNEQVVTRLNEIDDRLFAITQQVTVVPNVNLGSGSQSKNQLALLRIQIHATDKLLVDSDYKAAIGLLRGLQWQLSQSSNEIAHALTLVIQKSLATDIERLQAQSSQPNQWQLQSIAIQNIQDFLHNHEHNSGPTLKDGASKPLTHQQMIDHEVIMTLNLASQASHMHDQAQLIEYLRQARRQLIDNNPTIAAKATAPSSNKAINDKSAPDHQNSNLDAEDAPKNIAEIIEQLDTLIANAPTPTPLMTSQVLDQSTHQIIKK